MTEPTYPDYLPLRKSDDPPPPAPTEDTTRVYADENGALRTVQSDGTDAPVAGAGVLPNPTDEGDVLTVVDGEWAGAAGGGSQPIELFTVPVSSAEILALSETPVVIVPGRPGFVVMIAGYCAVYKAGATPFSGQSITSNMQLQYATGDSGAASPQPISSMDAFIGPTTDQLAAQGYGNSFDLPVDDGMGANYDGADLVVGNQDTDPTDGDGIVILSVLAWYAPIT